MKLRNLGSNTTELTTANDNQVLISYETPVAACINGEYYRTSTKWSATTSKHINKWLDGVIAGEKPQEFFDNLLKVG